MGMGTGTVGHFRYFAYIGYFAGIKISFIANRGAVKSSNGREFPHTVLKKVSCSAHDEAVNTLRAFRRWPKQQKRFTAQTTGRILDNAGSKSQQIAFLESEKRLLLSL